MSNINKFCAVVILYNPEMTVLESIKTYSKLFEKVYVMDNSNIIKEELRTGILDTKAVNYFSMNGNKGISHALNVAFTNALKENYDYILTMDQDSIFSEENISYMIDYINKNDNENIGIFAANYCRIYNNNNEVKYSSPRYPKNQVRKVLCAITSGSFVKIKAIKNILPLDENYFIANVDIDLGAQILLAGYSTVLVGTSIFYQPVGGVIKKSFLGAILRFTNYASTRYYYLVRNNFYFRKKYKKNYRLKVFSYIQMAKFIFKIVTSEQRKAEKIKMGFLGFRDFKKGIMHKKEFID